MACAKILLAENFYCSILQPSVILIARHHTEEIFGRQKAKDREWFNILQHARELELSHANASYDASQMDVFCYPSDWTMDTVVPKQEYLRATSKVNRCFPVRHECDRKLLGNFTGRCQ